MTREESSSMKTIVIANQKGGVGKTTTAVCMAAILRARKKKVLLVDTDMQCNATDSYQAKVEDTCTLYDLILEEKNPCTLEDAIQHTPNGDIIAADPLLKDADSKLLRDPAGNYKLKEALEPLTGYDYVIIDTNPVVNSMFYNALVAADSVIIPITAGRYSTIGLSLLVDSINVVKKYMNPALNVDGLLVVMFNERTRLNRDVREGLAELSEKAGIRLFDTYIRESTKCKEAQVLQKLLIEYAPNSTTEQDYEAFVDEWLKKRRKK